MLYEQFSSPILFNRSELPHFTGLTQDNKVPWLRIAGALLMGVLLLGVLLPSTGGMIANPAPSAKMWRCGPFLFYPGPFFGILGTITVLTSFTVFGVVRRNSCEFVGWVLLGVAFLWILFA